MGDNDSVVVLVPKGYRLIAKTERNASTASVYYNSDESLFFIVVDDKAMGPIPLPKLSTLSHVIADVIDMRGNYFFLE